MRSVATKYAYHQLDPMIKANQYISFISPYESTDEAEGPKERLFSLRNYIPRNINIFGIFVFILNRQDEGYAMRIHTLFWSLYYLQIKSTILVSICTNMVFMREMGDKSSREREKVRETEKVRGR